MGFGGEGEASFRKYAIRNTFARLRYRNYRYFVRERIVGPTTQFSVDPSAAAGRTTYGTSSTYSLLSSARNRFRTRTKRSAVRKREQRTVRKSSVLTRGERVGVRDGTDTDRRISRRSHASPRDNTPE